MGNFRNLDAWRFSTLLARDLHATLDVRRTNAYPGFRDQILRAAASIASTLAEGCAKRSRSELARYADMAYASAKEVENHIEHARNIKALTEEQYADFVTRIDHVARLCFGLARKRP